MKRQISNAPFPCRVLGKTHLESRSEGREQDGEEDGTSSAEEGGRVGLHVVEDTREDEGDRAVSEKLDVGERRVGLETLEASSEAELDLSSVTEGEGGSRSAEKEMQGDVRTGL